MRTGKSTHSFYKNNMILHGETEKQIKNNSKNENNDNRRINNNDRSSSTYTIVGKQQKTETTINIYIQQHRSNN